MPRSILLGLIIVTLGLAGVILVAVDRALVVVLEAREPWLTCAFVAGVLLVLELAIIAGAAALARARTRASSRQFEEADTKPHVRQQPLTVKGCDPFGRGPTPRQRQLRALTIGRKTTLLSLLILVALSVGCGDNLIPSDGGADAADTGWDPEVSKCCRWFEAPWKYDAPGTCLADHTEPGECRWLTCLGGLITYRSGDCR